MIKRKVFSESESEREGEDDTLSLLFKDKHKYRPIKKPTPIKITSYSIMVCY